MIDYSGNPNNYVSFEACINLFEFNLKIQRKEQLNDNHTSVLLRTKKCVVHALSIKARSVNTQQNINIYVL